MFGGQEVESAGVQMLGQPNLMTPVGTRVEGGTPLEYKYLSENQAGDPHVKVGSPLTFKYQPAPEGGDPHRTLPGDAVSVDTMENSPLLQKGLSAEDTPLLRKELVQKLIDLYDQNAGFSVA